MRSAIYHATVMHERRWPRRHRFTYGVYVGLFDLDELPTLDRTVRGFGYDRAAPFSFHDRDHGPRDGSPLRPWVEGLLREAGIEPDGGPIAVLAMPRVFGYVFNPISVWFAWDRSETLRAVIYEVANTFGERLSYVCPVDDVHPVDAAGNVRHTFDKQLHVSPFIDMDATYDFRVRPPDERVAVLVRETLPEGHLLTATLVGTRRPFTSAALWRAFAMHPMVTLKVIAGIHFEALRLWRKDAPFRRRGAPPPVPHVIESDAARRARDREVQP